MPSLAGIDTVIAQRFLDTQSAAYAAARPLSKSLAVNLAEGFYGGVPMHWMRDWPMPFAMSIAHASGASITDVDGHTLADFCLGDTGSMFGHSPEPVAGAIIAQAHAGLTYMLPTPQAVEIGALLRARFGLPHWQIAATATDANRYALRVARAVTGRDKILVFNGCYHGTVDETFVRLDNGRTVPRAGLIGQANDPTCNAVAVEFNDIEALERALRTGEIACVITEPVLTNSAMVLPDPGFHDALRRLTRETGTLLLIDETHTISSGPGGYTRRHGLEPDIFVLGKPIAGGVPASVWGFSDDVAARLDDVRASLPTGHSGMGTTLSANALALAAMHATLTEVMTDTAYDHMEQLAALLADGLARVITAAGLPWHVARVGARVEFIFAPAPLRNGTQAEATHLPLLESAVHLGLLNRGVLIAPFHNMMLVSPATSEENVARLIAAFGAVVAVLTSRESLAPPAPV